MFFNVVAVVVHNWFNFNCIYFNKKNYINTNDKLNTNWERRVFYIS